jgi:hypothetical protein
MANNNFVVRNGLSVPSGNITLGQGSFNIDPATGAFVFVPAATTAYPNPQAVIITAAGTITTTSTTGGTYVIASADAAANASASSGSSIGGGGGYAYEVDGFVCNGIDNLFPLTYNNQYITVGSPWNLSVYLDGIRQPAFSSNAEPVFLSTTLPARTGYTLDTTQVSYTANATGSISGNTITISPWYGRASVVSNVALGMLVTGAGIPSNCTVTDANIATSVITLSASLGQTITNSNVTFAVTNIKFADVPTPGSVCTIEAVSAVQYPVLKQYPFRPLDIALGY